MNKTLKPKKRIFSLTLAVAMLLCSGFSLLSRPLQRQTIDTNAKVYLASDETIYARGGALLGVIQERIDYAYKVEDEYINPYKLPGYLSCYTCGIHAGGNIVAHYDRVYEELIPNHTGSWLLGKWRYGSQSTAVDTMFSSLYNAMGATSAGVTIPGYKTGLNSYVSSKGRTIAQTQCMAGNGILNTTQYKTALSNGKLMSVFVDGFALIPLVDYRFFANYDTIDNYVYAGAHIMAVYGYLDVWYYNAQNQCIRKDSYFYVCSGFSAETLCLAKINQYCQIDDGYINEIY